MSKLQAITTIEFHNEKARKLEAYPKKNIEVSKIMEKFKRSLILFLERLGVENPEETITHEEDLNKQGPDYAAHVIWYTGDTIHIKGRNALSELSIKDHIKEWLAASRLDNDGYELISVTKRYERLED